MVSIEMDKAITIGSLQVTFTAMYSTKFQI